MKTPSKKDLRKAEIQERWVKFYSCERKKSLDFETAQEVVSRKSWYRFYICPYCNAYHLTKRPIKQEDKDNG